MATLNLPAWGYGLRYRYGLFKQRITKDGQTELPEDWLEVPVSWIFFFFLDRYYELKMAGLIFWYYLLFAEIQPSGDCQAWCCISCQIFWSCSDQSWRIVSVSPRCQWPFDFLFTSVWWVKGVEFLNEKLLAKIFVKVHSHWLTKPFMSNRIILWATHTYILLSIPLPHWTISCTF